MQNLPDEIYSVAIVREIDRRAIEDEEIAGYTLMTRAGEAAVKAALERFPEARRWQVICGAGNNAGDGYVVARLAAAQGVVVSVIALVDPDTLSGDAAKAYMDFAAEGGAVGPWSGALDAEVTLIVDGILGSGLERPVSDVFAKAVAAINDHPAATLALDIPTGLHGDTGKTMGVSVAADMTMTFVGLKAGLFLGDGPAMAGEVRLSALEIPDICYDGLTAMGRRISERQMQRCLPRRRRDSHKGDFGHVLVIGGGAGMPGAVRLCGEAALRSGAGRVSLATDSAHAASIVATRPELMSHGIASADELRPLLDLADVIAFGPGLGQSEWSQMLYDIVAASDTLSVWDADALNLLAGEGGSADSRVLTPHPGEAATLLDVTTQDIQLDRADALLKLQSRYGGTIVLKGSATQISSASGPPYICTSGNPGMAAPGMGDVLTGIVAALLAQGCTPEDAAMVGVEAHARAGDKAALGGERGLMASDLLAELRGVLNP